MKCQICKNRIGYTFLEKIKGTYVKDKGKKIAICFDCQSKLKNKKEILEKV